VQNETPTFIDYDIQLQNDIVNVESLTLKVPTTTEVYEISTGHDINDIKLIRI